MPVTLQTAVVCIAILARGAYCLGEDVLFEDTFDRELSNKWQVAGLEREDYRIRDGALEVRLKPAQEKQPQPLLKVDLPFTTSDTVVASVEVKMVGDRLQRGEEAGLCLTGHNGAVFTVRKTNIDGYSVLSPGEVDFIGKPGQEGNPDNYAVKYWPALESFGPLRITVRADYAYFQVGPSAEGKHRTFFHTAIRQADKGLGFGLRVTGVGDGQRWARFDNFRVAKP